MRYKYLIALLYAKYICAIRKANVSYETLVFLTVIQLKIWHNFDHKFAKKQKTGSIANPFSLDFIKLQIQGKKYFKNCNF